MEGDTTVFQAIINFKSVLTPGLAELNVIPENQVIDEYTNYQFILKNKHNLNYRHSISLQFPDGFYADWAYIWEFKINGEDVDYYTYVDYGTFYISMYISEYVGPQVFKISMGGVYNPYDAYLYPICASFILDDDAVVDSDCFYVNIIEYYYDTGTWLSTSSATNQDQADINMILNFWEEFPYPDGMDAEYDLYIYMPYDIPKCNCAKFLPSTSFTTLPYTLVNQDDSDDQYTCHAKIKFTEAVYKISVSLTFTNPSTLRYTDYFYLELTDSDWNYIAWGDFYYYTMYGCMSAVSKPTNTPNYPDVLTNACFDIHRYTDDVIDSLEATIDPQTLPYTPSELDANCAVIIKYDDTECGLDQCPQLEWNYPVTCSFGNTSSSVIITSDYSIYESDIKVCIGMRNPDFSYQTLGKTRIQTFTYDYYLIDDTSYIEPISVPCDYPCKTCTDGKPTECLSCFHDWDYPYFDDNSKQCVLSCPYDSFINPDDPYTCYTCHTSCYTCSISPKNCTDCKYGKVLFNGTCINQCPENNYEAYYDEIWAPVCQNCSDNCHTCEQEADLCTSCPFGYFLGETACVTDCESNQYRGMDSNGKVRCLTCSINCKSCSLVSTHCTACDATSPNRNALYENDCIASCPTNYFPDPDTGECKRCESPCKECSGSKNKCTVCYDAKPYLQKDLDTCVATCPTGYIVASGWCVSVLNQTDSAKEGVIVSVTGDSTKLARSDNVLITAAAVMLDSQGVADLNSSVNDFTYKFEKSDTSYIDSAAITISNRTMSIKPFNLDYLTNYSYTVTACSKINTTLCGNKTLTLAVSMKNV